ncbi:hypothetical protein [Aerosticca soli]|nr:hypothetical protein [Aerosticca soli]MDI3261871.1 hypothetical protein [Fulvimonas sp.]
MNEHIETTTPDNPTPPGAASQARLADFFAARLTCEHAIIEAYRTFLEKCRRHPEPAVDLFELATLERFRGQEAEHAHLLHQVMEALGLDEMTEPARVDEHIEASQRQVQAITEVIADPGVGLLPSLHALVTVELIDEAAWGLLLALVKDAEMVLVQPHVERIRDQQHAHRVIMQQRYEALSLQLLRDGSLPPLVTDQEIS